MSFVFVFFLIVCFSYGSMTWCSLFSIQKYNEKCHSYTQWHEYTYFKRFEKQYGKKCFAHTSKFLPTISGTFPSYIKLNHFRVFFHLKLGFCVTGSQYIWTQSRLHARILHCSNLEKRKPPSLAALLSVNKKAWEEGGLHILLRGGHIQITS